MSDDPDHWPQAMPTPPAPEPWRRMTVDGVCVLGWPKWLPRWLRDALPMRRRYLRVSFGYRGVIDVANMQAELLRNRPPPRRRTIIEGDLPCRADPPLSVSRAAEPP